MYIVQELCSGGDVASLQAVSGGRLSEREAAMVTLQASVVALVLARVCVCVGGVRVRLWCVCEGCVRACVRACASSLCVWEAPLHASSC